MKQKSKAVLGTALLGILILCSGAALSGDDEGIETFADSRDGLGAALGQPSPESTVVTHADGTKSAIVGVSHMKALVVRKNEDGSFSYGHVASEDEARAFAEGDSAQGRAIK